MFPGFKSPPIGLKQTNSGTNLVIPYGTSAARANPNQGFERGTNNLVIGSGITAEAATLLYSNIILGILDDVQQGYTSQASIGTAYDSVILAAGANSSLNSTFNSNKNILILAGAPLTGTMPYNSILIGSGTATLGTSFGANSIIAIGANVSATAGCGIAIGLNASDTGGGIAIGTSALQTASAGSIAIGAGAQTTYSGASGQIALGSGATVISNYIYAGLYSIAIGAAAKVDNTAVGATLGFGGVGQIALGNAATANWSGSIAIGATAVTDFCSEINLTNNAFATAGDIHTSLFPMYVSTTNATATEIAVGVGAVNGSPSHYIILSNNASYAFTIDICAQTRGGTADTAMWTTQFLIQRKANAASTALVGTPSGLTAPLFATTGAVSGAWAVAVTADTTNGRPAIKVTGAASTNISWVANVRMTKVGY